MENKYLTFEQSICAARVFLNLFGLKLEEKEEMIELNNVKVLDQNGKEVGLIELKDGFIDILTNSNFGKVCAKYAVPIRTGMLDKEYGFAQYNEWRNDINFNVSSEDNRDFSGFMQIACFIDSQFGVYSNIHTSINYLLEDKSEVNLRFMIDGQQFGYEMKKGEEREVIKVMPFDDMSGFIIHDFTKGKFNIDKPGYLYRKYAGVRKKSMQEEDILIGNASIEENYKVIKSMEEEVKTNGDDSSKETLIQKGLLMQNIDPSFAEKIREVRDSFFINGVSLFDNLIGVSYENYTDEEINAMFGLERRKVNFQNETDNLMEGYFGLGDDNKFLSKEAQKKLMKKKAINNNK